MAQLVERPTEKPGATLTRVCAPGAARDFFSPRVQHPFSLRKSDADRDVPCQLSFSCSSFAVLKAHGMMMKQTKKGMRNGESDADLVCLMQSKNHPHPSVSAGKNAPRPFSDAVCICRHWKMLLIIT